MDYKVRLKGRAKRFVLAQPAKIQRLLIKQLEGLARNPTPKNSKELDSENQIHKVKFKKYRILYQIQSHKLIILVVAIGNQRDIKRFYRELRKLIKT